MRCPECQHPDTRVIDSRNAGDHIRRRRECLDCGARYTTHERLERPVIWVIKKTGGKEPFTRDKVLHGISLACRKRPIDANAMREAVEQVQHSLEARRETEIPSSVVGETVMEVLRDVDEVAYVRFASVYRAFESVGQFVDAIRPLREGK
jgi:transcriptional repressor NrdR